MSKSLVSSIPCAPTLRLLGGFSLERPGERNDGLSYEKGRALLAYIAMETTAPHPRKKLAELFWPDLPMNAALSNLRQVLLNLRQVLNDAQPATPCLLVDREFVSLDSSALHWFDVADFSAMPPLCTTPFLPVRCTACLAKMENVAGLYRGEFMAGFFLPDCQEFEDWLLMQREALRLRALTWLMRLSDCHEQLGAFSKAVSFALRYTELAPWDEEGHRRSMRLLALNGESGSALAKYTTCCRILKNELGVQPGKATHDLVECIRKGELQPLVRGTTVELPAAFFPPLEAERRQVTILYCELSVDGVEDPDEAMALLLPARQRWIEKIRHFSGYVVEVYTGDLLAYFGYPQACENAARQALQAAQAITRDKSSSVGVRAGIHTGLIITGGSMAVPDAVGATTSTAIRLRYLVESGEVAISETTHRLVTGYFDCTSLGVQQLQRVTRPIEVFKLIGETGATHRLAAAAKLTPLVGRKAEIIALMDLWEETRHGSRRAVLLRGDAGIGKSRLMLAVKEKLNEQACKVRELRCFPEFSQSPFHPLIAHCTSILKFTDNDTAGTKFFKLVKHLEEFHPELASEAAPLLAEMLKLPLAAPHQKPALPSRQQREDTFDILLRLLHSLAEQQPLMLVVEDLHWIDPSTLELLMRFINQQRSVPTFVIFTARSEFQSPWREDQVTNLLLEPLVDDEVTELIGMLAPDIAQVTLQHIVERAEGIPLFAEELVKIALSEGESAIPATLHDLLAARLDSTGPAKATAQLAATIGRKFTFDVLRRISPLAPDALKHSLQKLRDARIVWSDDEATYQFMHALIQDAAYQSLTRSDRQSAHLRIAKALQHEEARVPVEHPEILAQHLEAGAEYRLAASCWLQAGKLASQHSADQEAIMHFRAGLSLIDRLPPDQDRAQLEFDLQNSLGLAVIALDGYASEQAASAHSHALVLCDLHEGSPDMFRAVWGLWASASSRCGYVHAAELAQQLLNMAQRGSDPVQIQQGHFSMGNTLFWQGRFEAARDHLERALALYQPCYHESHVTQFGEDVDVTSGSYLSWVQWFLGEPEQARRTSTETLARARQSGHPFSLAYALTFAAILHCRLRQAGEALALAEETLALADSHGFQLWQIGGSLARGWALAMQGHAKGVGQIQRCIELTREAMRGVMLIVLGPLADAHICLGQFEAALGGVENALNVGETLGDHHLEAELLCLKGEALLGLDAGNRTQAETCFRQALAISREQQAKTLEMHAAAGLDSLFRRGAGDTTGLLSAE
ncbi:MAG: AAA family ATPase [Sulfuricella denitrificans]|nr:AAA family ATPase [Sulfuricella denitrificans]